MKEFRMPTDIELKAQAKQIKEFCSIVLPLETQMAITPKMPDDIWQEHQECRTSLPPEFMALKKSDKLFDNSKGRPIPLFQALPTFLISTGPNGLGVVTMRRLWALTMAGYNIYYSINPLKCSIRNKATTKYMDNFLIESDETDLETQRRILQANRHMFVAYYYSGNKSIHAIAKLDTIIQNKFCYGYLGAKAAKENGTLIGHNSIEYSQAGLYIRNILESQGLILCQSSCSSNYAQISRLPTFPNVSTANLVNIEYTNAANRIPLSEVKSSLVQSGLNASTSIEEQEQQEQTADESTHRAARTLLSETITKPFPMKRKVANYDILKDFQAYDQAIDVGLPSVGTRLVYERIVARIGRAMKWNDNKTIEAWKTILGKSGGCFRGTEEDAVNSLTTSLKKYSKAKVWLPMETVVLPDQSLETLTSSLYVLPDGKLEANVHNILLEVVFPLVKQAPQAATDGRLNIKAVDMMKACADRRYKPAVQWMIDNGILSITNEKYCIGAKTKAYRVNIPLMLHYLNNR